MRGTKFSAHFLYLLQKGTIMTDELKQKQPVQTEQHPYQTNTEPEFKCDPNDKECANRWVEAFGDCA